MALPQAAQFKFRIEVWRCRKEKGSILKKRIQKWSGRVNEGGWAWKCIIAYLMINIYYVGRRNHSPPQRHPSNIEHTHMRRQSHGKSIEETSLSSCRKTQKKYLHLKSKREGMGSVQRKLQINTDDMGTSQSADRNRVVVKRSKRPDQEECSGIEIVPLIFNRVRQPPRHLSLMAQMKDENNRSTQRKCEKPLLKPNRNEHQAASNTYKHTVDKVQQEQTQNQYSQLVEIYKMQPKRKLFLCSTCLLYLPYIEISSHHTQCQPPKKHSDYILRWERVTDLLMEIHRAHPNDDQLFRLCELMDCYPSCRKNKHESPGIYSQQLQRILRYKLLISLSQLNTQDVFWVIQTLGDKVETMKTEPTRWLLCY